LSRGIVREPRLGLVGAGFIAQVTHLHALSGLPGCAVVAIADYRADLRTRVASKYAIARQYDAPADLLADPDVDAFLIILPRRAMGPAVEAALATGKPVFAEKPMAHTLAQGQRLTAVAGIGGAPFAVGFMKRHDSGVQLFRDILARFGSGGEMGSIVHVGMRDCCATYGVAIPVHFRTTTPPPYRLDEWTTLPNGLPATFKSDYEYTLNVASHDINLLRFLFGDGITAGALRVRQGGMQTALLTAATFDLVLELGRVDTGRWEQTIDVYYQRGKLSLSLPSPLARDAVASVTLARGGEVETMLPATDQRIWCFKAQAAQFLDVVRGNATPLASGADALADLAIIEALWNNVTWSA
jgi:predicted dehydrogenase